MGLFEKLGLSILNRSEPAIEPVPTPEDPQAVLAPVTGRLVALGDVSDPAFSQGMLGTGVGIKPEGNVAFSPVTGTVVAEVKSAHALLIKAQSGAEVLLHVGLDSVALHGAGFRQLVRKGDEVRAGVPVLRFDRDLMAERGLDDTVVVTVTNPEAFERVEPACAGDEVVAGAVVLRTA
ncbi:MAG TPA: PTS glucose transporter subunit IIA [Candidatus Olsenella pullistercoris]|uniref:PTS glucose transporter subunit IIA n=1 Tax=Candidatus Olsenella pullistercoris TaxID=2838712 RepID=A0A9D2EYM3_9ACTN|nr:PTS glucose transporter subunit IIA [Candidatus Olsenella pullistercoris]